MGRPRPLEALSPTNGPSRARSAQVDPDRVLLLDVNYTNNSKTLAPQGGRGGDQVVVEMAGLARGRAALVGVLRVTALSGLQRPAFGRVNRAPAALVGVWMITLLASVPLSLGVRAAIAQHLGSSLEADTAAAGVNYNWMLEFGEQASGVNATFGPTVIGFGAVLDNLSAFIDREARPAAIVGVGVLYLLAWTFLAGGLIDRYARDRAIGAHAFFQACGGVVRPFAAPRRHLFSGLRAAVRSAAPVAVRSHLRQADRPT